MQREWLEDTDSLRMERMPHDHALHFGIVCLQYWGLQPQQLLGREGIAHVICITISICQNLSNSRYRAL